MIHKTNHHYYFKKKKNHQRFITHIPSIKLILQKIELIIELIQNIYVHTYNHNQSFLPLPKYVIRTYKQLVLRLPCNRLPTNNSNIPYNPSQEPYPSTLNKKTLHQKLHPIQITPLLLQRDRYISKRKRKTSLIKSNSRKEEVCKRSGREIAVS